MSAQSRGEATIAELKLHLRVDKLLDGCRFEYVFHNVRKWRFDLCWPELWIAVEIDGGNSLAVISKTGKPVAIGRHTQRKDYEKLNYAALLGWRILRFTPAMVKDGTAIAAIKAALNGEDRPCRR